MDQMVENRTSVLSKKKRRACRLLKGFIVCVRAGSFETGIDARSLEDVSVGEGVDRGCSLHGLNLVPVCEALKERT
jgi:hypothetical protein